MLSVAVIFFTFGLGAWVIGLYLLGMGSEPAEGGSNPLVLVGWVELVVGLVLAGQVFILVNTGVEPLAGLVGLFSVFFTAFGIALITGADLRPIGNLAVPVGILAALYFSYDGFNGTFIFQSSAIWWGVVFLMVAGFTYGKVTAKNLGYALVITAVYGFLPVVYLALDKAIP